MHTVRAAIDRRLEEVIVAWLRRERPALWLVPAPWIRRVVRPSAIRFRRLLSRLALAIAVPAGVILVLLVSAP